MDWEEKQLIIDHSTHNEHFVSQAEMKLDDFELSRISIS